MTQRMGAQRRSHAAGFPSFHQNAMSNPLMFSCCHAIKFITFLRVTQTQIFGIQFTSYTTYILVQDSTFLEEFQTACGSSISSGRCVPVQPFGLKRESLAPTDSAFFLRRRPYGCGSRFKGSGCDTLEGATQGTIDDLGRSFQGTID